MAHELVITGETFQCRDTLPAWALLKLAKASRSEDEGAVAGLYDLIMAVLLPAERTRFEEHMDATEPSMDDIQTAIGDVMQGYTDRPTERPSPSPAGLSTTGLTSRVVSLSRGTVRTEETSPKDGAQAVS